MSRRYTDPADIAEVEALSSDYSVDNFQVGCYLIDDWLFIWPRRQRWGERYKNIFGHYQRGKLKEFVEKAYEGKLTGQDQRTIRIQSNER